MSNKIQNPNIKKFDLIERTATLGKNTILFVMKLPKHTINNTLISQVVRSATSIGANYMEADGAESKKDFQHKLSTCKKEAKETMHWFHMLSVANPERKNECRMLWKEAHELALIFSTILKK